MRRARLLPIVLALIVSAPAWAQDPPAYPIADFLTLTPSTRSWGMGRAGAAVADPYVGFFNPGGIGVYADGTRLALARNSQDWLPKYSSSSNFANAVAVVGTPLLDADSSWFRLNFALAYMRTQFRMNFGILRYPEGPEDDYTVHDVINSYGASLTFGKGLSIGIGGSIKSFEDHQDYVSWGNGGFSGTARDLGVFVQVPVIAPSSQYPLAQKQYSLAGFKPELWLVASYAWANFGKDTRNPWDYDYSPLPRLNRFGRSAIAGIQYHGAPFVRVLLTRDDEISKTAFADKRHEGWEIGFLGIVELRRGDYSAGGSNPDVETSGESYHLRGLWQWADIVTGHERHSAFPPFVRSLDAVFQRARIKDTPDQFLGGTDFWEFGLTLDIASLLGQ